MADARAEPSTVEIGDLRVANVRPLTLIAGPCQLEGRDHALRIAEALAAACAADHSPFYFGLRHILTFLFKISKQVNIPKIIQLIIPMIK
jgi:hypothetical protein